MTTADLLRQPLVDESLSRAEREQMAHDHAYIISAYLNNAAALAVSAGLCDPEVDGAFIMAQIITRKAAGILS